MLKFALGAGGFGLSRHEQMELAALLHTVEAGAQGARSADFTDEFGTAFSFVTGLRSAETGYLVDLPGMGTVLLVAQVGGIVFDYL